MDSRSLTLAEEKEIDKSTTPSLNPSVGLKGDLGDSSTEKEDGSIQEKTAPGADAVDDDGDYPSGFKLVAIVVALICSIFLVRLVSPDIRDTC